MAGVAGILGRPDDTNRAALQRMSAALAHRGPHGERTWIGSSDANGNACLLVHRRLNVLDIAATSPQPLAEGGFVLAIDGTVLNYNALRAPLQAYGHDVTVLRHLAAHGPEGLPAFQGPFALALWDERHATLLLARDPLGHRPLYLCRNPDPAGTWRVAFASELRALLASGLLGTPRLDPAGVASLVWNGFVMSPVTMVKGVASLLPGAYHIIAADGTTKSNAFFWSMPEPTQTTTDEGSFRTALRDTIKLNLQAGVPIGAFLSGGIDSSSIANLAQKQSEQRLHTFCLSMEEASLDEADAARQIAAAIGTEHHDVRMTEAQFLGALDDAIAALDQPTFDGLNQYHICKAVREAGMGVALGGIAGDAIYGGDRTLKQLPRLQRVHSAIGWLPEPVRVACARKLASFLQKSGGPIGPQTKWAKLPDVTRAGRDLISLYQLTYALFRPDFYRELLGDAAAGSGVCQGLPPMTRDWVAGEIAPHSGMSGAAILETRFFAGERLLRDADTVASALSLELRSPLADAVLVGELNRLPESQKYRPVGRKPLLRKHGLEGLNPAIFERRKAGFVLPFDRWIRQNLGQVMDQVLRDPQAATSAGLNASAVARLWQAFRENAPGLYWTRVWTVYVLIRWCQRHGVTI